MESIERDAVPSTSHATTFSAGGNVTRVCGIVGKLTIIVIQHVQNIIEVDGRGKARGCAGFVGVLGTGRRVATCLGILELQGSRAPPRCLWRGCQALRRLTDALRTACGGRVLDRHR